MDVNFALKYGKQFILTQLTIKTLDTTYTGRRQKTPTALHRKLNR